MDIVWGAPLLSSSSVGSSEGIGGEKRETFISSALSLLGSSCQTPAPRAMGLSGFQKELPAKGPSDPPCFCGKSSSLVLAPGYFTGSCWF